MPHSLGKGNLPAMYLPPYAYYSPGKRPFSRVFMLFESFTHCFMLTRFTLLFVLFLMGFLTLGQAQPAILLVDDTPDGLGHVTDLQQAIDSAGYSYTVFNAVDSSRSPSDLEMAPYDLVIWQTGSAQNALWLWNGLDEDNGSLKAYLNGGGKLWLIGTDLLFDRYGSAPDSFAGGDFVYDYLGVSSYDLQTFVDDGELGIPYAYPDTAQPITGLDTLTWIFATLWYVDGVTPRPEAVPIMRMGDASYAFADSICGLWYDSDSFQVLTFFFNLAQVANFEQRTNTARAVLDFFFQEDTTTTRVDPALARSLAFQAFPNPVQTQLTLAFSLDRGRQVSASLWSVQGQQVAVLQTPTAMPAGTHRLTWQRPEGLSAGTYFLRLSVDGQSIARPLRVQP